MSNCDCEVEIKDKSQRRVLIILLYTNAAMFVFELSIGWWAESTALIADALDMLADALVYAVGLYAVGKSIQVKANAAILSGILQLLLGLMVLLDISRRLIIGSDPASEFMMGMGAIALVANLGVIVAGALVWSLESRWPDILIGLAVSIIILLGAKNIIQDAIQEKNRLCTNSHVEHNSE